VQIAPHAPSAEAKKHAGLKDDEDEDEEME